MLVLFVMEREKSKTLPTVQIVKSLIKKKSNVSGVTEREILTILFKVIVKF